jgi:hypothetical protein
MQEMQSRKRTTSVIAERKRGEAGRGGGTKENERWAGGQIKREKNYPISGVFLNTQRGDKEPESRDLINVSIYIGSTNLI